MFKLIPKTHIGSFINEQPLKKNVPSYVYFSKINSFKISTH